MTLKSLLDTQVDINKLLQWWTQELIGLIPESIKNILYGKRHLLIISLADEKLIVRYITQYKEEFTHAFSLNDSGKQQYQKFIKENPHYNDAYLGIRLPEHTAITKEIIIPEAVRENIHQAISYQIDTLTPFRQDDIYFDTSIITENKVQKNIKLRLILTPKKHLDNLYNTLINFGIKPEFADIEPFPINHLSKEQYYNLLPKTKTHKKNRKSLWILLASFMMTLLLLISIPLIPLAMDYKIINDLEQRFLLLNKKSQAMGDISSAENSIENIIALRQKTPSLLEVMDVLSNQFNSETSLKRFTYKEGGLEMEIKSNHKPSELIETIENLPYFEETRSEGSNRANTQFFSIFTKFVVDKNEE